MARVSIRDIADMKARGEKVPIITVYDYTSAQLADSAGIPMVLVGDSLGMVVLGYDSTIPVTMETCSTTQKQWPGVQSGA